METDLSRVQSLQIVLLVMLIMVQATSWGLPVASTPANASSFDFIVVGGGTAGSVLANRLSANIENKVLLIEAGGLFPITDTPGTVPVLPISVDDFTAQNLPEGYVDLRQGKVLNGSGVLNHLTHFVVHPGDFDQWAEMLNDDTWKYKNIQPYLKRVEKFANEYGTDGRIKITREKDPENSVRKSASDEHGHDIVDDIGTKESRLSYYEPLYANGDGLRQSSAVTYLSEAKSRSNLRLVTYTNATKILIKDDAAIGVQVTDPNGDTQVYLADKEVIVSAGALNSPKLLMLSGIGPKDHLESHGIDVLADLPVGKNLQCHTTTVIQLEEGVSPLEFSAQMAVGDVALDPKQAFLDYQKINLVLPHAPSIEYTLEGRGLNEGTKGDTTLLTILNLMVTNSCGEVLLVSAHPADDPIVIKSTDIYSDYSDLKLFVDRLKDIVKVLNTTNFGRMKVSLNDGELCQDEEPFSDEYWSCYVKEHSKTVYSGTSAMGLVLDNQMKVVGIDRLRVVDASVLPEITRGNPNAVVLMLAERASDFILDEWKKY